VNNSSSSSPHLINLIIIYFINIKLNDVSHFSLTQKKEDERPQ
jgi:hypothetical protein